MVDVLTFELYILVNVLIQGLILLVDVLVIFDNVTLGCIELRVD
jgi:hypothetical protein